ncbi:lipase class 3 family protein [Macrolepiota fuliginosa MF-IS2]|uniref:Lipase class 3 family protein n=1 Tax=Macrolepiota fuliginosa MF-IS2 TaxID=1400762 RepID=A0A9P5X3J4_9AGAR|nr:lipase class 3 family protein [Macrolepiota fuliginosa MF-IS2]
MLDPRTFLVACLAIVSIRGSPVELWKRQSSITTVSDFDIAWFTTFTHFASTAYCDPSITSAWSCGGDALIYTLRKFLLADMDVANCQANSDFIPVASGGDGSSVQFWYVGYSPSQGSVIVAHQGTTETQIEAIITDLDIIREPLDSSLFPGISSDIEVHRGFADEHAKTATQILSAVQTAISQHGANHVTIVGHSLGGAIALLDGIYLPLYISGVFFRVIGYGTPRVGNQEFADYVDSHLLFNHINNKQDIVPTLPGQFLGYRHPSGEIHIDENNQWLSCPGQDNPSDECIVGAVPMIFFFGDTDDHTGPYNGIDMGC